jgi:tetratricopeptide (TPR) repeat protein
MTNVVCKKCGHELPLEGGLPPVWKVIKCPSCGHGNIIQGTQGGGPGPGPGKMAPPSIPVTLGPPGVKPAAPTPPAKPKASAALDLDLGESGNETIQEEPTQHDFARVLQDTQQHEVTLGAPGDAGIELLSMAPGADDVDLGEPGNETVQEEAFALPAPRGAAPAKPTATTIDLGAPGSEPRRRQRELARDNAATVDLGSSGYEPPDDVLALGGSAAGDDGLDGLGLDDIGHSIDLVEPVDEAQDGLGLALVEEEPELPAPVTHREPELLHLPPPRTGGRPAPRASDTVTEADLPAPARAAQPAGIDLPAPARRPHSVADLPAPAQRPPSIADLPAPAQRPPSIADLPAPAQRPPSITDLPAPARRAAGVSDLPAPAAASQSARGARAELPTPIKIASAGTSGDLPAPKGFFDDLPEPADAAGPGASGLPAPKGFFDDLPEPADTAPASPSSDLPIPKGFEPSGARDAIALAGSAGSFDDLGLGQGDGADLFGGPGMDFNPLGGPPPAAAAAAPSGSAPAGFGLDDDPFGLGDASSPLSLADPEIPSAAASQQPFALNALDLEAPRGDDGLGMEPLALDRAAPSPQPGAGSARAPRAAEKARPPKAAASLDSMDLGGGQDIGLGGGSGLELGGGQDIGLGGGSGLELGGEQDIGLGGGSGLELDDFGLPNPSVPGMPTIPEPPRRKAAPAPAASARPKPAPGDAGAVDGDDDAGLGLDLPVIPAAAEAAAKSKDKPKDKPKEPAKSEKPAGRRGRALGKKSEEDEIPLGIEESAVPRVVHGHLAGSALTERHLLRRRQRRKRIIMATASVVVVLMGVGGFFAYREWNAERTRKASLQAAVNAAVAHLRQGDPGHWDRAFEATQSVLALAPNHPDGLGIAAEASFAALLDEGLRIEERRNQGTLLTRRIDEAALVQGEHVEKAQALKSIDQGRPPRALELLRNVLAKAPNDPDALLYQGWAHAAAQDYKSAAADFQRALETAPARQEPALYGLARAQLEQGDRKAAEATFDKLLAVRADHFGALLGKIEADEALEPDKREERYLALVQREDAKQADPRIVSRAWMLAGRLSLGAGRIEAARTRFENALKAHPANVQALVGRARVAILQDRFNDALEALTAVLGTDPGSVDVIHRADAVLARAELGLRMNQPDVAKTYIELIFAQEKQIEDARAVAQAYVLHGRLLATDEAKREEAITAYKRALEIAGADALEPALQLAELYTTLGRMDEARTVLEPVEARATSDAVTAIALGVGYRRANALNDAETWLRKALALRPKDVDAQFQLGQVLAAKKQYDEAIQILGDAAQAAPERAEIGLRLAMVFEELGRVDEAAAAYERLLEDKSPSLELMARAGRFYVQQGKAERAGELGERILAIKDSDAAGHFLRGEAKYRSGEYAEARVSFRRAADLEPNAEYFEASGRASEQLDLPDEAFEAYSEAARLDPNAIAPRLGRARLLIARRDYPRAMEELTALRALAPKNARIYHYLGEAYQRQEDHKEASSYLRTALEYDGNQPDTHYLLGKTYLELDKERDAARAFDTATTLARRQGGSPPKWLEDAYYELGYVQRGLSKRREAIQAWKAYLELVPEARQKQREVIEVQRLLMSLEAQTR